MEARGNRHNDIDGQESLFATSVLVLSVPIHNFASGLPQPLGETTCDCELGMLCEGYQSRFLEVLLTGPHLWGVSYCYMPVIAVTRFFPVVGDRSLAHGQSSWVSCLHVFMDDACMSERTWRQYVF